MTSLDIYKPENKGPLIEDALSSVILEAGKKVTISVGKPIDLEGDAFYVDSWSVEKEAMAWVKFNNVTSQLSLDFTFTTPAGTEGKNFTIVLTLAD